MKFHFLFIPFFSFSKWKLNYEPLKWFKRKTREKKLSFVINFIISFSWKTWCGEGATTGCCNHYDASADFMLVILAKWFIDHQYDEINYFLKYLWNFHHKIHRKFFFFFLPISIHSFIQHNINARLSSFVQFYFITKKEKLKKRLSASREQRQGEDFHYYR